MRLCSHVVVSDTGLAPNPFFGYCTTALCTPSHMRARANQGDWLVGNSPKADGNRLVYAMRVSQVLSMDQYFSDRRFDAKKPDPDGDLTQQCGDNLYFRESGGSWSRAASRFHNDCDSFVRDVGRDFRGRPVFVSDHFYYFGSNRVPIPEHLSEVVQDRQGIKWTTGNLVHDFLKWLESGRQPGVLGRPSDMSDRSQGRDSMLTSWPVDCEGAPRMAAEGSPLREPRSRNGC